MWTKALVVVEVVFLLGMLTFAEYVSPPAHIPFRTKMAIVAVYLVVRALISARWRRRPLERGRSA